MGLHMIMAVSGQRVGVLLASFRAVGLDAKQTVREDMTWIWV